MTKPRSRSRRLRTTIVGLVLGASVALAGCGRAGTALSAGDYRARMSSACQIEQREIRQLPAVQHERRLTIAQVDALAASYARRYRASVARLQPPSGLRNPHAKLLRALDSEGSAGNSLQVERRRLMALFADYRALGATGCVAVTRAGLREIAEVSRGHP